MKPTNEHKEFAQNIERLAGELAKGEVSRSSFRHTLMLGVAKAEKAAYEKGCMTAYMDSRGIPKDGRDELPFGEEVRRLTTVQDILDATTPENLEDFLDDLRMVLIGSFAARMECPGMKLDHIDWTDDGERVAVCDMPDGSILGISHKEPTDREVIQHAKEWAKSMADERKGYSMEANMYYAYRTGMFHGMHKDGVPSTWTSVTEAMPDDDISVNVMWHSGLEVMRVSPAATWQDKWYVLNYCGKRIEGAIVTHWQYLPRPIEKEGTTRKKPTK